ncbi:hypothetical protein AB0J71_49345 [Nonomuraea sp. NPDC049637]|uniref:hypothetical protein n=1 Tax=Nonomuraea sp. NPDC049637 TaxID=3154356 RepID=UPI00341750BA
MEAITAGGRSGPKTWKLVAGTLLGAAAGIPLGLLLSAFLTWRHVLAGIVIRGPLTIVMKYSDKEWDEAFDLIAQDPGISTVPVTRYMIFRWE